MRIQRCQLGPCEPPDRFVDRLPRTTRRASWRSGREGTYHSDSAPRAWFKIMDRDYSQMVGRHEGRLVATRTGGILTQPGLLVVSWEVLSSTRLLEVPRDPALSGTRMEPLRGGTLPCSL